MAPIGEGYVDRQENRDTRAYYGKRRIISGFPCMPGYYYSDGECVPYRGNKYIY